MGVIIGVMIGYALGCRAGSDGWAEVEEAWHTIATSNEVRDFADGALAIALSGLGANGVTTLMTVPLMPLTE